MANSDDLYLNGLSQKQSSVPDANTGKVSLLDKIGFNDLKNDTVRDAKDFGKGLASAVKDRLTFKNQRNDISQNIEFNSVEVSIANRHRDAISGILNNTFSGNLFDAGVSTLNLLNYGTKWRIAYTQDVDKDLYPFKYIYYYDLEKNKPNYVQGEDVKFLTFLDELEDPTMLGYSLRIDYDTSPLFSGLNNTKDDYVQEKKLTNPNLMAGEDPANIKANDNKQVSASVVKPSPNTLNSCINFINTYLSQHPELGYASSYLYEFTDYLKKIFTSPEVETGNENDYFKVKYKNSYIYSIKGLNKLDNYFVSYKDEESERDQECLELTLGEDIRMYVYRMFYIYKNLIWSYNMGKKLIPENLLRFNLYIKVSDVRSYTSGISDDFKDIVKNGYSRIVYELKDCEFIFPEDENLLPDTLNIGGKEVNEEYAELKIKIKYRKVNRIFYSNFFNPDKTGMIIGDKFFTPNKNKYFDDLTSMKYAPNQTIKRNATDNNIPVVQSVASRIDRLKNNGILVQDNNDTALTRFAKSIGNNAIKAGGTILDDKMQQTKANINDFGKNVFNNNLSSSVRDLLKDKVQTKSKILGKSLHLNTGKQFSDLNEVVNFSSTNLPVVNSPREDLHPNLNTRVLNPKEDLHPTTGFKTTKPNEDLHPDTGFKVSTPNEDLHPDTGFKVSTPNEDLHPNTGFKTTNPNEDLHPDTGLKTIQPNEDLHPDMNLKITQPNEDLHPNTGFKVSEPKEDLHPNAGIKITTPNEDLHPSVNNSIKDPNENVNPIVGFKVSEPNEDLHSEIGFKVTAPNENLTSSTGFKITAPNENVNPTVNKPITDPKENVNDNFTKFIKKNIETPPSNSALGDC